MKLKVLCDNYCYIDHYYYAEPGLSFYIEDEGVRILFDTGYSDVVYRNARKMGIDLNGLDYLIFSHGHNDHTGGLKTLLEHYDFSKTTLLAHPLFAEPKYHNGLFIGSDPDYLNQPFKKILLTKEPYKISPHLTFLGEITRSNDFENKEPVGFLVRDGKELPDHVFDDTALMYENDDELFIISGCSHSGIANICEQAKRLSNKEKLRGIIGGFHLLQVNEQLLKTIAYFREKEVATLYPCHCVCLAAKCLMAQELNVKEVGVSFELEL